MRNIFMLITLLLHIEYAYGMEEALNLDVMKEARHIVRPLVRETLQEYVNNEPIKVGELDIFLRWTFASEEFVKDLNSHIILYLRDGKDPEYVGCPHSFKGIHEALSKAGITLSEDRMSLTQFLQENKKRSDPLLPSTPLIRGDQALRTPPCCCFQ
jgi:hypothetical protein